MPEKIPSYVDPNGRPPVDPSGVAVGEVYEADIDGGGTETVEITHVGENETGDDLPGAQIVAYQNGGGSA